MTAFADLFEGNVLNLNDAFHWGTADGERVEDSEMPRLEELYERYGECGVLYWVAREKRGLTGKVTNFCDVQRKIDFVEQEERIRVLIRDDNVRAYTYRSYVIPTRERSDDE